MRVVRQRGGSDMAVKLHTNLIQPLGRSLPAGLALVWGLVVFGGAALALQMQDAGRAAAERQAMQAQLARLQERRSEAGQADDFAASAVSELLRKIRAVNAVSDVKGPPATLLLSLLERHLPEQAYLLSLHHRHRTGELRLVAEAPGAEPLSTFLQALESDTTFTQVMLMRQSREPRDGRPAVQFEIKARSAGHD